MTVEAAVSEKKKTSVLKWVFGILIALVVLFMGFGAILFNSPQGQEKHRARMAIEGCWSSQGGKSIEPGLARFIAGACEKMERDFQDKYGVSP